MRLSLPGFTRQSISFERPSCEDGWMPGSSPGMTSVFATHRARFQTARPSQTHHRIPAARFARVVQEIRPSDNRGRGECRAPDAPAAACAMEMRKKHPRLSGHTGITRHSPRNGFNGFLRALPGDRLSCHRHPAQFPAPSLNASIGASEPHDFSVRLRRSRQKRHPRPPHPVPRS